MMDELEENVLTDKIINAAIEVHKTLGPGLKEEIYKQALIAELKLRSIKAEAEVPVVVKYKGIVLKDEKHPKRIDVLVEKSVIVECKALATAKDPVFKAQCLTYLKMTNKKVGLVLNFGRPTLKEGIERVVNTSKEEYLAKMAKCSPATFRNILREEQPDLSEEAIRTEEKKYRQK